MRPMMLTCRYQLSVSITVSETRGSLRRCSTRLRPASMLTRIRSPCRTYQVATVTGCPPGRSVAITDGFGLARKSRSSSGSGEVGMAPIPSPGRDVLLPGERRGRKLVGRRVGAEDVTPQKFWVVVACDDSLGLDRRRGHQPACLGTLRRPLHA